VLAGGLSAQGQAFSNAVMALHPLAYWPLQETNLPPASPVTQVQNYGTLGTAENGNLSGNVVSGPGPVTGAQANAFDGIQVYNQAPPGTIPGAWISAPYAAAASPAPPFSIEAWVNTTYPTGDPYGNPNGQPQYQSQQIVLSDMSGSRSGWVLYANYNKDQLSGYTNTDYTFRMFYNNGTTASATLTVSPNNTVGAGQWMHVVIVVTNSTVRAYTNGVSAGSATFSSYVANNGASGATGLAIATRGDTDREYNWAGAVAEVAYYTNVLLGSDALADYNARNNAASYEALVQARHPIIWWKMDELLSQPVATNCGSLGAAANGYYPTDWTGNNTLLPGVAGPTNCGFGATSVAWQSGSGRITSSTGPGVPCGVGSPAMWNLTGSISLMAWARAVGNWGVNQDLIGHSENSYRLWVDSGNYPDFGFGTASGNVLVGANKIAQNDENWHFWVGTYNATNNAAALYIDGVPAASGTFTAPTVGNTAAELLIGGAPDWTGRNFIGNIAHAAIFNSALSSVQVSNLYNTTVCGQGPVVIKPVFPNPNAECWSSSTYVFQPAFNGFGQTLSYAWTLDSGYGPVPISGAINASLAFQSIPGLTVGGGPYTLNVTATTIYGSTNSSVTLTIDAPPPAATTIYSDSFTRSGALSGTAPDMADLYSALWTADGSFTCNGSSAVNSSAYAFAAWLPFIPQVGHVYTLSCDLNPLNSSDNWLGLGFATAQDTGLQTGELATYVEARGNRASANSGAVVVPGTSYPATGVTPFDASGSSTYQIELDTATGDSGSGWTIKVWEDGILLYGPDSYPANPSILSAFIGNYQTGNGAFDNFKLTDSLPSSGAPVMVQNPPAQLFAMQGFAAAVPAVAAGATSYQWQLNGNNLADNGRIVGAHATRLSILAALPGDTGTYQLIAWNGSGSVTSSPCALTVGTAPVGFASASDPGAWTINSSVGASTASVPNLVSNLLTLTDGSIGEAGTAFFNVAQYIGGFYAKFTYQVLNPVAPVGDGATFCLQDDPRGPTACGGVTYNFGLRGGSFSPSVAPSAELVLNLYSPQALVGYSWNTQAHVTLPTQQTPGSVNIANGDPITMTLYYDGSSLGLTMTDAGPVATNSFSTTLAVGDLTSVIGSRTAYVGFSGSDGDAASAQTITNFMFVSLPTLPKLWITENGSGQAVVTWPGTYAGFSLLQRSDITATNWASVSNPVTVTSSGNCQVTVPVSGAPAFYRLMVGLQ